MDAHEVKRVRATLALFVADAIASIPSKDQRAKSDCYLRGLMMAGRRKSIQAMASRLPDGNEQNLQQFVDQSTWDPVPVRRRIARRLAPQSGPAAWAIKSGRPGGPATAGPASRSVPAWPVGRHAAPRHIC